MNFECHSNSQVIKLYAWEMSFEEKVDAVRNLELDTLRRFCYLGAFSTFAWSCAPFIVSEMMRTMIMMMAIMMMVVVVTVAT